ncbi:MAG TPA: SRPBCC domain-containing protein [Deinococcales bacterium]|nr:SRPBCC domain-containing protein [Deinococcales bacterium]
MKAAIETREDAGSFHEGTLTISREFAAPRDLVFRAWTQAEHFARWFGPHGSAVKDCVLDARAGGTIHFRHEGGSAEVWVGGTFLEVTPPERIRFEWYLSDASGAIVPRPGFSDTTRVTAELTVVPGGTLVSIRHEGLAREQGELQGWMESLDRLDEHLRAAPREEQP